MTNEKLYEVLGDINEKHVYEARAYHKAKSPSGQMGSYGCLPVSYCGRNSCDVTPAKV